jgi:hypothetical protein
MAKEKGKKYNANSYIVPKTCVYLFLALSYIMCAIALIYLSRKYYAPISTWDETKDILDIVIDELGNSITFTSGFVCVLINFISQKEKQIGAWTKRVVAFSLFLLFNFCRCANALKLTANQFSVILFAFYLVNVLVIIILSNYTNVREQINNMRIKGILGKIRNQNILSIQLFDVEELKEGEYCKYTFKFIDALCQNENDINGMLSTTYRLKNEYVSEMTLVLLGYQKLIESGDDTEKQTLISSIERNKEKLLNELKQIRNVEEVDKEQCCIARMIILYLTLENMLQDANSAGIQALDGVLGLENIEIEKRLFTYFRTGILGAIFLGQNDIYTFNYWKDGSKIGRKYCAFQINRDERMIICMVVLRERKNNILSKDIVYAIKNIEKKLNDSWEAQKEISIC